MKKLSPRCRGTPRCDNQTVIRSITSFGLLIASTCFLHCHPERDVRISAASSLVEKITLTLAIRTNKY